MANKGTSPNWGSVKKATLQMHEKDRDAISRTDVERQQRSYIPLKQIKEREQNTRDIYPKHVEELIESIATLGLLEPLVVDNRFRLLAGGHRLAAIQAIQQNNPDAFNNVFLDGLIPVRIMPFDANKDPEMALKCEVAENEHRRDYTPKEVRALAERLLASGYVNARWRPKAGEKALVPALRVIVGKSRRTIMRYLSEESEPEQDGTVSVPSDTLKLETKALDNAWKQLKTFEKLHSENGEPSPKRAQLLKKLPRLLDLIESVLVEIDKQK